MTIKNVQIIDGADNCTYSIFVFSEEEFAAVFPAPGQDIAFIDEVIDQIGDEKANILFGSVWLRPVQKSEVVGIHGTLFYELNFKKRFYPTRVEAEMVTGL